MRSPGRSIDDKHGSKWVNTHPAQKPFQPCVVLGTYKAPSRHFHGEPPCHAGLPCALKVEHSPSHAIFPSPAPMVPAAALPHRPFPPDTSPGALCTLIKEKPVVAVHSLSAFFLVCCLTPIRTQACVTTQANPSSHNGMSDFLAMFLFYKWAVSKFTWPG